MSILDACNCEGIWGAGIAVTFRDRVCSHSTY
jgi:hypothetical protein